jgi:hypothetical protein
MRLDLVLVPADRVRPEPQTPADFAGEFLAPERRFAVAGPGEDFGYS